jgi:TRAP-type C4-dicarboxylate transport system permease small subunit
LLAFFGQDDLEIYFTINIIVYLVITLLYVYFNPRARRALSTITTVLFAGFMVIVVFKVMEILGR